jgi:hypothetical protein
VTNLDFVELLLKKGADPNSQDHLGGTPLTFTKKFAPGAAKFLLNWPTTTPIYYNSIWSVLPGQGSC